MMTCAMPTCYFNVDGDAPYNRLGTFRDKSGGLAPLDRGAGQSTPLIRTESATGRAQIVRSPVSHFRVT